MLSPANKPGLPRQMQRRTPPSARILLLSATPYKMYTVSGEADEDHYRDFVQTVDFLQDERQRAELLDQQTTIDTRLQQLEQQIGAADAVADVELPAAQSRLEQFDAAATELLSLSDMRRRRGARHEELAKLAERLRAADCLQIEVARLDGDLEVLRSARARETVQADRLVSVVRGHSGARLLRDWARLSGTVERVEVATVLWRPRAST